MKQFLLSVFLLSSIFSFAQVTVSKLPPGLSDSIMLKKISDEVLANGQCYKNLEFMCRTIGGRLSGSAQAQAAVEYTFKLMKDIGVDTVYLQECMVPHWVRGKKEVGEVINSKKEIKKMNICALGGSVSTAVGGITADIIEVKDFDELKKLGTAGVKGKIVFFNHPFDVTKISTFEAYGEAGKYRWTGPSEAARYGAIGTVVRSMTTALDDNPHTGVMDYNDSMPKVPCCAISTKDAERLRSMIKADPKIKFHLDMTCQMLSDVKSYNVIGEIKGSEHPEEIITVGGHLDSWDLGKGAQDDGAGCVQSIEVIRALHALGIKPKRTIRAVMFMNEENGGKGGDKYFELAKLKNEKQLLALESDAGGFTPRGFGMDMPDAQKKKVQSWRNLFLPYGVYDFEHGGDGADISDLKKINCALMGLHPDGQRYFDYHHTQIDNIDAVSERELKMGASVMTMMIWMVSEYGLN